MKTEFSTCPAPYKIERIGEHSAKISFAENAIEIEPGRWIADVYELVTAYTVNIEDRIESNLDAWLKHAKDVDYEKAAVEPALEERVAKVETIINGAPSLSDAIKALAILLEE